MRVVIDGARIRVLSKNVGPTRGEIGKAKGFEKKLTSKPTPTVKKKIMTFQVPSQPQTAEAEHSVYGKYNIEVTF